MPSKPVVAYCPECERRVELSTADPLRCPVCGSRLSEVEAIRHHTP